MTNGNSSPYDLMLGDVSGHRKEWQRYARFYGLLYPLMRIGLIVASAIVAAGDTLKGTPLGSLVGWVAVLALAVAIVTALDTWMKPAVRWQASVKARDDFEQLKEALEMMPDRTDRAALEKLDARRGEILSEARTNYVF